MLKSTQASLRSSMEPDLHFDVVGMPDPVFGDTVWYVLGTGTVDGEMFAQYAQEGKQWHKAARL